MSFDYTNVELPKWPQMIVWGDPVTVDRAKEIIWRTDQFLTGAFSWGGNNKIWNDWASKTIGITAVIDRLDQNKALLGDWTMPLSFRLQEELSIMAQHVNTRYVHNTWASSCFVYGPYGWCSPEGNIFYEHNIGKWPTPSEVLEDWKAIAKEFPFLNLTATLFSGESCEESTVPLVTIKVSEGLAYYSELEVPDNINSRFTPDILDADLNNLGGQVGFRPKNGIPARSHEQGIPDEWIIELGERLKPVTDKGHKVVDLILAEFKAKATDKSFNFDVFEDKLALVNVSAD